MEIMLKSKIYEVAATDCQLNYQGSITIDRQLMTAAKIYHFNQVDVLDKTNGVRLTTYAIPGDAGEICINGAAAKLINIGDDLIILCYEIVNILQYNGPTIISGKQFWSYQGRTRSN